MRNRGYVEGENLILELRSLEGRLERASEAAADMIRLKVDVILATQNSVIRDAKRVTTAIPIVMLGTDGPVEEGLVTSLARPGGNVTGLSADPGREIYRKRLELLKAAVPGVSRVAFIGSDKDWKGEQGQGARAAAQQLGLAMLLAESVANDYAAAFAVVANERANGIFVASGSQNYVYRRLVAEFASKMRLPAIYPSVESVEAGGLMAYGVDIRDDFRRAAIYVDRILKGATPSELPIERPSKFELVLNLKAAKALGLTFPQSVLLRADRVIE